MPLPPGVYVPANRLLSLSPTSRRANLEDTPQRWRTRWLLADRLRGPTSLHPSLPLLRRRITATIIPACAQMTRKHKSDRHTDLNMDSPSTPPNLRISAAAQRSPPIFPILLSPANLQQFQIRLSHHPFQPVKKKDGRKAMKTMISSLLKSGACLVRSTLTFHLISFSI